MRVTLFISAVILSSDVGCGSLMTEGKIGLALASHEKQYKDDFLKGFK